MAGTHVPLPGSHRPVTRAERIGDVDPEARIEVTLTLRGPELPQPASPVSREDFERQYAARPEDIGEVTAVLSRFGLTVEDVSPLARSLRASGTAEQVEQAFHPGLGVYRSAEQGEYRGREGQVEIPAELDGLVTGVFGLDQRRVARRKATATVAPRDLTQPLRPGDLESHYNFPSALGAGQTVAIAEFGGAYFPDDLAAFCAREGRREPKVTQVGVGTTPLTLDQVMQLPKRQRMQMLEESIEVNMDVQILAGLCPQAQLVVYFASFDEKGWVDLVNQVIASSPVVTLSVSWGLAEDAPDWSSAALAAINERLQAASVLGTTVCVAAGDDGSGDQIGDDRAHVDFPASSPFVLAIGGTMLQGEMDVVWWEAPGSRGPNGGGATGGGVSIVFPRPDWQAVHVASVDPGSMDGRVVPDVAGLAGPPLYDLLFLGKSLPNGGTSASAPLWASLLTRIAASRDPAVAPAFLAPLLYQNDPTGTIRGKASFVDVTQGDNISTPPGRGYKAGLGFDAVSGWGVPNGQALAESI